MENTKSKINKNVKKNSENSINKEILLQLSKELVDAHIVSEIKYIPEQKLLKLTFSDIYNNETLAIQGMLKTGMFGQTE